MPRILDSEIKEVDKHERRSSVIVAFNEFSSITVGDKLVAVGAMTCSNNRKHVVTESEMYDNVDYMVAAYNKIPTLIAMINHFVKKAASCENDSSYVEKINEAYHVVTNSGDLVDVCKINVYEQKDNINLSKE